MGSLGGDIGECGRGLIFLDKGGGVSVLCCACCVKKLLPLFAVYLRFWLGLWALVVMVGGWEISFVCLSSDCKGVS